MTCVCWDGKTLAADKLVFQSGTKVRGTKIKRIGQLLVGYTGAMSLTQEFFSWVEKGFPADQCPKGHIHEKDGGTGMVISKKDNSILIYDRSATPYKVDHTQHAIGSGAEAALACLYLQHTAKEAVQAVIAVHAFCGEGIDILEFNPVLTRRKKQ